MAEMVLNRKDDPYGLLAIALHVHLTPLMQGTEHSYKDLTPIAKIYSEYNMMVVRKDSPIETLDDVTEALKKDPGSIYFGGATVGTTAHITVSTLATVDGVDTVALPYIDYLGGESRSEEHTYERQTIMSISYT